MNVDLSGYLPSDDDFADIDMSGGRIDKLLINRDGEINYNPGDDVSIEDILNGSLNGPGNDSAFVIGQQAHLEDNDKLINPVVGNHAPFNQSGSAHGGTAYADEGIDAGGSGGSNSGYAKASGGDGDDAYGGHAASAALAAGGNGTGLGVGLGGLGIGVGEGEQGGTAGGGAPGAPGAPGGAGGEGGDGGDAMGGNAIGAGLGVGLGLLGLGAGLGAAQGNNTGDGDGAAGGAGGAGGVGGAGGAGGNANGGDGPGLGFGVGKGLGAGYGEGGDAGAISKAYGGDAHGGNGGNGGTATVGDGGAGGAGGMWGSHNGDDAFVNGISEASANAAVDTTAFNMSNILGANILGNQVDMTVVGGDYTSTITGEDDAA